MEDKVTTSQFSEFKLRKCNDKNEYLEKFCSNSKSYSVPVEQLCFGTHFQGLLRLKTHPFWCHIPIVLHLEVTATGARPCTPSFEHVSRVHEWANPLETIIEFLIQLIRVIRNLKNWDLFHSELWYMHCNVSSKRILLHESSQLYFVINLEKDAWLCPRVPWSFFVWLLFSLVCRKR